MLNVVSMSNGYITARSIVSSGMVNCSNVVGCLDGRWRSERIKFGPPLMPLIASVMVVCDWLPAHSCSWTLNPAVRQTQVRFTARSIHATHNTKSHFLSLSFLSFLLAAHTPLDRTLATIEQWLRRTSLWTNRRCSNRAPPRVPHQTCDSSTITMCIM